MRKTLLLLVVCLAVFAQEPVDLNAVHRIRTEALERSKVSDIAFHLTDENGPRLTNSPNFRKACEWAAKQLKEWGLENVKIEKWPFGRGWSAPRFAAHMLTPERTSLNIVPLPWSAATKGAVTSEAVLVPSSSSDAETEKLIAAWKGKLKGKIVFNGEEVPVRPATEAPWHVWTPEELAAQTRQPTPEDPPLVLPGLGMARDEMRRGMAAMAQRARLIRFFTEEGVAAVFSASPGTGGGMIRINAAGSRESSRPATLVSAAMATEQYNRIVRLLSHNVPVKMQVEIETEFQTDSEDGWNVVAEIPGKTKPTEIVMIGGHIDSWTGGTGALDNGAGAITAMEAIRILKTLKMPMDRTVRIGLWGGEEQGLLGSRAHVKERFGSPHSTGVTMDYSRFSVYFNLDYGSGRIRGIYMDGNDAARPIFEAWFKPFADMGATMIARRAIPFGGSDHSAFESTGLPGYMFMQDPLNYFSRFHSNLDAWENASPNDIMHNAAIMASFAYNAATRPGLFPRKPLPAAAAAKIPFKNDIEYRRVGNEKLTLDAYVPSGDGPFPAVVVVHGGGFTAGDKRRFVQPLFEPLQKAGFAWFSIDYRLAPKHRFPAAVEDVEAAVAWVREHAAEYKVDPKRIALMGESAGGHLVAFAGATRDPKSSVAAVVSFYGPHDFEARFRTQGKLTDSAKAFLDITEPDAAAMKRLRAASPIQQVRKGMPPYLLIHGTKDETVPFSQSELMCARMKRAGAVCELYPVEGGAHGVGGWERKPETQAYKAKMTEWLKSIMK